MSDTATEKQSDSRNPFMDARPPTNRADTVPETPATPTTPSTPVSPLATTPWYQQKFESVCSRISLRYFL